MSEDGHRILPLRAGRRAAGAALLGWLDDDRSPRLCRIAGSAGSGKSHLLDWLAQGFATEQAPERQRVHAVLPAGGVNVRAAVWSLGHQLGIHARLPEDLVTALGDSGGRTVICVPELGDAADPGQLVAELLDPLLKLERVRLIVEAPTGSLAALGLTAVEAPAVLDLDQPQWTDQEKFEAWCAKEGADAAAYPSPGAALGRVGRPAPESVAQLAARVPRTPDGAPDPAGAAEALLSGLWTATVREGSTDQLLSDAALLTYAGPVAVTAALDSIVTVVPGEASDGPERIEGPVAAGWDAGGPALIAETDPGVRAAVLRTRLIGLEDAAAARLATVPGPWRGAWALWPNSSLGWPGPVAGLAVGAGRYAGQLLLADLSGTIRTVDAVTGTPLARVETSGPKPLRGLTVTPAGHLLLLDSWGSPEVVPAAEPEEGLDPAALEAALSAQRVAAEAELSVLAAVPGLPSAAPAVADGAGSVHWYQDGTVLGERLHDGPVTALAGAVSDGAPVLVSGGFDGAVRLWSPGSAVPEPLDRRAGVVTAVAAAESPAGLTVAAAWGDGLVRVWRGGRPEPVLDLRLGSQIWALGLAAGLVVAGTPEGVAAVDF
ncbi:hypothetical protein GCM10010193_10660 [Kitasatospora atroaurantiaca]|uniref:Uncharacterized protein n=1 Tax=Kitasatospora atroaurantiaca TaxID=285545 RepID=A0A561ESE4_9ACTN|nr:WD40 repeat domain-containing protein [Kitasatospora atroaurantiaca]TWE18514.1 hypothetical protein FB465_3592 [Kitasatospora atroaurantiaca]